MALVESGPMQFPPLTPARILRRYKRFLADCELADGTIVTAHCPNTGSMTTCWAPGVPVALSHSDDPRRKLAWTLERVDMGGGWIGVNTVRVNGIVAEGITDGLVSALAGYRDLKREPRFETPEHPRSRLDLLLTDGERPDAFVEIKNTTLLDGDRVRFPDAVTERGRKHLDLLLEIVRQGRRGVILFAVSRPEGSSFSPADTIDPAYGARLREVAAAGVEVLAVRLVHEGETARCGGMVPVVLD